MTEPTAAVPAAPPTVPAAPVAAAPAAAIPLAAGGWASRLRGAGPRARALGFAAIGLSGFAPNLGVLWLLTAGTDVPVAVATILANQVAIGWNFLLTDRLLYRRQWSDGTSPVRRFAAYAGLSNTDLLLRVPLTHWLVTGLGCEPVTVTAALLLLLAAARFLAIDRLLYRTTHTHHATKGRNRHAPR